MKKIYLSGDSDDLYISETPNFAIVETPNKTIAYTTVQNCLEIIEYVESYASD